MRPSMTSITSLVLAAAPALALALAALPATTAKAHCVMAAANRWDPGPGPIPVYVSTDSLSQTALYDTQLGQDFDEAQEIRWVKAAIDLINSASTDAPRLYYAGTDASASYTGGAFWSSRNEGITVSTYGPCFAEPSGVGAAFSHSGSKGAIRMIRGNAKSCGDPPFLWWTDPRDDDSGAFSADYDFVGVLAHELLHSLGLDHTDGTGTCDPAFADANFPAVTQNSLMYPPSKDFRRGLRRDDIEGLRALHGEPERDVYWSKSSQAVPSIWMVPALVSANLKANTPVVISNAALPEDEYALVGLTNAADQVRYLTGSWGGWDANAATGVQVTGAGGEIIRSFDRVGVARGRTPGSTNERRLVAWVGGPESTSVDPEPADATGTQVRIHYRVQQNGVWFPPHSTAPTRTKTFGVGYDPGNDLFMMAYLDTCTVSLSGQSCLDTVDRPKEQVLFVRTIKGWLGGGGCIQALTTAGPVHEVGDVACNFDPASGESRCTIPVATTEDDGPFVRYIEGVVEPHDGGICFVRQVDPPTTLTNTLALGWQGAAIDGYAMGGTFVGTRTSGFPGTTPGPSGYATVYTMTRNASGWVTGASANESAIFETQYWPLAIGGMNKTTPSQNHQWRLMMAK